MPIHSWTNFAQLSGEVRTVVLFPFDDRTLYPGEVERLRESLAAAMASLGRFTVVRLDSDEMRQLALESAATGNGNEPMVLALARKYEADAVVTGTVTHLNPYGDPAVALRVEMKTVREGLLVWRAEGMVDTSERRTLEHMKEYNTRRHASGGADHGIDALRRSMTRFFEFTADAFVTRL